MCKVQYERERGGGDVIVQFGCRKPLIEGVEIITAPSVRPDM